MRSETAQVPLPRPVQAKSQSAHPDTEKSVTVEMILYFTAVAEEMSFTRAAKRMGIDQSWLSHKIRQMEGILQCLLFTRSTRHIELTAEGEALLGYGRKLALAAEEAQKAAAIISQKLRAIIRVGALPYGFWYPERTALLDQFSERHVDVAVEVVNGTSAELLAKLRAGDVDIAFVCGPIDSTGLDVLTLAFDHYSLLIPADDPLARLEEVRLADLKGKRLVTIHAELSPMAYEDLYGPLVRAGAIPVPAPEFQMHALTTHAARQRLLQLCNNRAVSEIAPNDVVVRSLIDHKITSPKAIVRRVGHRTAALEQFWSLAQAMVENREN